MFSSIHRCSIPMVELSDHASLSVTLFWLDRYHITVESLLSRKLWEEAMADEEQTVAAYPVSVKGN